MSAGRNPLWNYLHFKIAAGTTLFTSVILIASFSFFYLTIREERSQDFYDRAREIADLVYRSLETAMQHKSPDTGQVIVGQLVDSLLESGEFQRLSILDKKGRIWISSSRAEQGKVYPSQDKACLSCHENSQPPSFNSSGVDRDSNPAFYRISLSFNNRKSCQDCHAPTSRVNGVLIADFSMEHFNAALAQYYNFFLINLAVSLAGMLLGLRFFLRRIVVNRISRLSGLTRRIGQGDLPPISDVAISDEISKIEHDFYEMCKGLTYQRKRNEELQQELLQREKLATIGNLVAWCAHELNTPIGNILSRLECLKMETNQTPIRDEFAQDLKVIERQSKRMARTVQGLLSFSRQSPVQYESVQFERVIREAVDSCSQQLKKKNIAIDCQCEKNLPEIFGNPVQLEQMVINLLNNSGDALDINGRILLSVRRENTTDFSGIIMKVEDDGPGFPPELSQRILLPFVTSKGPGEGVGLGLAIVSQIVSQHRGTIRIGKSSFHGALTEIYLPNKNSMDKFYGK
ncbi:MAG: HAMP domain-containing sensor histidine kinase [Candidatus Omnitrophota bacterium]